MQQILDCRYIDRDKLINVLDDTFGKGGWMARVSKTEHIPHGSSEKAFEQLQLNRWILSIPQALTEVISSLLRQWHNY
jgi:hypothetical protein